MKITLPTLKIGDKGPAVLTLRALLYARDMVRPPYGGIGVPVSTDEMEGWLINFLNITFYNNTLRNNVVTFQMIAFPNDANKWDGIVGDETWSKLIMSNED